MEDTEKTKEELIQEVTFLRKHITEIVEVVERSKETERALVVSEGKYRSLVESTDDSIYLVDRECRYLYMNRKHMERLNLTEDDLINRSYADIHSSEESRMFVKKVEKIFETGESLQFEYQSKKDGRHFFQTFSPVFEHEGSVKAVTIVSKDISKLKQMEEKLRTLSLTDDLTGLYNRRGFQTLATMQFNIAQRMEKGMYLLYADLDNLKTINDTYGHKEGDKALIAMAGIFKDTYRRSDIIARIGGDEFVVIPVGSSKDNVQTIIDRLQRAIDRYNRKSSFQYLISLSAGIAYYDPKNPCTADELLERADSMMYEQKRKKQ